MLCHIVDWVALRSNRWEAKQVLIIKNKTVIYLYGKNSRKFACKRDLQAQDPRRDRDIWFSVRDETEIKTFPHFPETETRPRHWKSRSRDRLETEMSIPRLQPCYFDTIYVRLNISSLEFTGSDCWETVRILNEYSKASNYLTGECINVGHVKNDL